MQVVLLYIQIYVPRCQAQDAIVKVHQVDFDTSVAIDGSRTGAVERHLQSNPFWILHALDLNLNIVGDTFSARI